MKKNEKTMALSKTEPERVEAIMVDKTHNIEEKIIFLDNLRTAATNIQSSWSQAGATYRETVTPVNYRMGRFIHFNSFRIFDKQEKNEPRSPLFRNSC